MKIKILLLLFSLCAVCAKAQPTLYNPLIPDNLADPTVMQFNDTFYVYATSDVGDQISGLSVAGNPVVWKSTDFVNWSFEGVCFPGVNWQHFRYWAPGRVIRKDSLYYLYVSIELKTNLAVSRYPEGPFRFIHGPAAKDYHGSETSSVVVPDIDSDPFIDDDGQAYVFWRRKKMAMLDDELDKRSSTAKTIPTPWHGYSEGPFMIKRKGIYYYFYTLGGYAEYQYAYLMSRISPEGPFLIPKEDVITQTNVEQKIWGPGHGFAFHSNNSDQWYFVYLEYGNGGTSRQIYANAMNFRNDGAIEPIKLSRKGVGPLGPLSKPNPMDLSKAVVRASSVADSMLVTAHKWGRDKELKFLLPQPLPVKHIGFTAKNAIDCSNATEWHAQKDDSNPWWQIDLKNRKKIDELDIFFVHPTLGQAFRCEISNDGKHWKSVKDQTTVKICSPHIVRSIGKTRFIRISILKGTAGIWEVKLYSKTES